MMNIERHAELIDRSLTFAVGLLLAAWAMLVLAMPLLWALGIDIDVDIRRVGGGSGGD